MRFRQNREKPLELVLLLASLDEHMDGLADVS